LEKKTASTATEADQAELAPSPAAQDTLETDIVPLAKPVSEVVPETDTIPIARPVPVDLDPIPLAKPVDSPALTQAYPEMQLQPPSLPEVELADVAEPLPILEPVAEPPIEIAPVTPILRPCPSCHAPRIVGHPYCHECGWMFEAEEVLAVVAPAVTAVSTNNTATRLRSRYEIREPIGERAGIKRFRGLDHGQGNGQPVPVIIVRGEVAVTAQPLLELDEPPMASLAETDEDEFLPTFDDALPTAQLAPALPAPWPGVAWEASLLTAAAHPALPAFVDAFVDSNFEYLIEEQPQGRVLWDAWDDPGADAQARYTWLIQIAEGLQALHRAGAIVEGLRPDSIIVTPSGRAMLADLSDLLPLPVPAGTPLRAGLYTAPELILNPEQAGAQADLYSFGAMLYSLEYLHHALEEKDFERQFVPNQITDRFPDVHPGFNRLINKTFVRDVNTRFPTDEASKEDGTGFTELIRTLDVCRRTFDNVRLDLAAWTTTGMVRTGNEDAFGLLHAVESRQDELSEYAVVLLADGMGGYEAGEVAAAMAIQALRSYLLEQPMFTALAGKEAPAVDAFDVEDCKKHLLAALKHANKEVYTAARAPGKGRRGMGCTAEAVYIDNRHLVVGHVGDSRTYHLHQGRLIQLTRDQTLVNRLVELGQLSTDEAENHPRKNELQQAIGGQPDVEPGLYHGKLARGDWVLVCSDGLTNHVSAEDLQKMLMRETANSAEEAARRLLNLVNLRGATDNATIVVIRAS
jgi:protein phosphatase